MTLSAILLANGLGELIPVIAVLIFAGLGALSKWAGGQKQQQEQAQQRETLERRRKELEAERGQRPIHVEPTPAAQRPGPAPHAVRRTPRHSAEDPRTAQRRQQAQRPAERESGRRVGEELQHEQERRDQGDLERQQRLTMYRPPEADAEAIAGRIVHVQPRTAAAAGAEQEHLYGEFQANLADPTTARNAIIFSEILGRPKALREENEMWDA